jgi:secreted Zn-dependent insulinase-like peptidase
MVDLTATGVGYSIETTPKGLTFTFSGFAPMMPTLITKVLKEFNDFSGNASATLPSRFTRVTQQIQQGLNTYSDMPITYALQDRNMLLSQGSYSRAESSKALKKVTRDSAASSVKDVLLSQQLRLTSLTMGNIAEK